MRPRFTAVAHAPFHGICRMGPIIRKPIIDRQMMRTGSRTATEHANLDAGGSRSLFFTDTTCKRRLP